jgi:hypothetical protein
MKKSVYLLIVASMLICAFSLNQQACTATKGGKTMKIISSAFSEGGGIPSKYTCDGQDISPPLEWKDAPGDTKSFALISDDPDAPGGTWVHWVAFNIPPTAAKLEENIKHDREFANGMKQGSNDWPKIGYGGPCPPSGTHRYYFKLYALDTMLDIKPGATKEQLLKAMKGHVLAEARLMGKYKRQGR